MGIAIAHNWRNRVACSKGGLQLFRRNPREYHHRFVTWTKPWIPFGVKQQSKQWKRIKLLQVRRMQRYWTDWKPRCKKNVRNWPTKKVLVFKRIVIRIKKIRRFRFIFKMFFHFSPSGLTINLKFIGFNLMRQFKKILTFSWNNHSIINFKFCAFLLKNPVSLYSQN